MTAFATVCGSRTSSTPNATTSLLGQKSSCAAGSLGRWRGSMRRKRGSRAVPRLHLDCPDDETRPLEPRDFRCSCLDALRPWSSLCLGRSTGTMHWLAVLSPADPRKTGRRARTSVFVAEVWLAALSVLSHPGSEERVPTFRVPLVSVKVATV